jgi:hypothetical protein
MDFLVEEHYPTVALTIYTIAWLIDWMQNSSQRRR